ncbi:hypothetical protein ES703_80434 [subsurface metagenome]|nr:hypothetical protein [Dehalococcoidia bacterium]
MDAMEAILSRRSIRQYIDKPVPEGVIKELLEAAMSAPSASNERLSGRAKAAVKSLQ